MPSILSRSVASAWFSVRRLQRYRNERYVNEQSIFAPSSRRIWRIASKNGNDSMSPTVAADFHDDNVHTFGNFLDDGI